MDQEHTIHCKLKLDNVASITPESIKPCTCYDEDACNNGVWEEWTACDGSCEQTRTRNRGASREQVEIRDCRKLGLCFLEVENDIDVELERVSIKNGAKFWTQRIMNRFQAYGGSLPYIARLTFQKFDEFHSDTQAGFQYLTVAFLFVRVATP